MRQLNERVTIYAVPESYNTTIEYWVNGELINSYNDEIGNHLVIGENIIQIKNISLNGTEKVYTINLNYRHEGSNTKLKTLSFSEGTMEPAFDSNVHNYTVTVPRDVYSVDVIAEAEDKYAFVSNHNGNSFSSYLDLPNFENYFTFEVIAENGDREAYYVKIIRAKSSDADLYSLGISNAGGARLTPNFSPEITEYTATVNSECDEIEIWVYSNTSHDKVITGTGTKKLKYGMNKFTVNVVAEDGTSKDYNLSIIRNNKPVIDGKDITVTYGDDVNLLAGVTATDVEDGNLTDKIKAKPMQWPITYVGTYDIEYSVTDSFGETVYKTYKLTVKEKEPDGVYYQTHIQDYGWQDWKLNGQMSGTSGEGKRLEGIKIKVKDLPAGASIIYRTHVQDYGWQAWKKDGEMSGTNGQAKRLEGIEIKLINAPGYRVEYRVHVQDYGWQEWKRDGQMAGTSGKAKRLEAIEIMVIRDATLNAEYRTHVQDYGWQAWKSSGEISGTSGESKRLEGIEIKLINAPDGARVVYQTHVQDYGWQPWKTNGEMSGTSGQAKRLEGIKIKLENAPGYKIEYRVHAQDYGWQEWKSDGEMAGTSGKSKRLEAIEIRIVSK